jgi:amidase
MPAPHHPDRRDFLQLGGLSLGALFVPSVLADPLARSADPHPDRDASAPVAAPRAGAIEFAESNIAELSAGIRAQRYTSVELVQWYLEEIDRIDTAGPALNSILEKNPEALTVAAALDAELRERGPRGLLHGLPVLLKDNIETGDRLHSSAGSLALAEHIAAADATLVAKLRAAGAVILGKANMSEWANARGRASIGGWSGRGRLTRNPYALDRSTGGSSSGTAAAVSANLCVAAVGTETMGSIINPASLCGVVGVRPTVGLVSRHGLIPVSITQDTAGPITRTVRDAALMLSVLAGADPADPITNDPARPESTDYSAFLDPDGLRGARIGVARNLFGQSLVADRVIDRALESIAAAGATVVDPADIETAEGIWTFDAEVLSFELKAALDAYLKKLPPGLPVHSLRELIAFNVQHSDQELAWFGQETFEYAEQKGPLSSADYQRALTLVRQLARTQGIDATLSKHRLDAIVAPASTPAWLSDMLLGDNTQLGSFVTAAAAGYPAVTVPAGDVAGLPVGLLFMGTAWSEGTLLKLAYAFEQRVRARRVPSFLPSIRVRP